jgi:protein-L-isoaspartate(D-aspartate) O-methyltransferase
VEAAERVREAMRAVPRARYLPRAQRFFAPADMALPIGHGQTNSQPSTVRAMLELLDVHEGHRVLDVGAGSGWTTAILAHLTGPTGAVVGVERVPALVEMGAANVARAGMPWARVVQAAPGVFGAPSEGPYDRILVSAEPDHLPQELVSQLGPGGVMVIPVEGRMLRVRATPSGPEVERTGYYRFVPLVHDTD